MIHAVINWGSWVAHLGNDSVKWGTFRSPRDRGLRVESPWSSAYVISRILHIRVAIRLSRNSRLVRAIVDELFPFCNTGNSTCHSHVAILDGNFYRRKKGISYARACVQASSDSLDAIYNEIIDIPWAVLLSRCLFNSDSPSRFY